jgi:hypothetical protein
MPQIGSHLFVLSYTRRAIVRENREVFGLRQPYMPVLTGTILLVRIMPLGGHRWIDVSRADIHLN